MVIHEKLYTVDEFEAFIATAEKEDCRFELIHGEIVEKMPTQKHAAIVGFFIGHLFIYFKEHPIAWLLPEARYRILQDNHNARVPDISVVLDRSRPLVEKVPAPYMPELAIEVQSPDDSLKAMVEKAAYYLQNGTRMVWLVYVDKRLIEVLTADDRQILTENDALNGGDLLPGFTLAVRDIFAGL